MKYIEEVKELVASILQIPSAELSENAEMSDIDGWDSLRNIIILQRIEEHFKILFPEDDVFDLTSVSALAEEVEKLKG